MRFLVGCGEYSPKSDRVLRSTLGRHSQQQYSSFKTALIFLGLQSKGVWYRQDT